MRRGEVGGGLVLNQELTELLETDHLLYAAQYGFRRNRGTEETIHDALDKIAASRLGNAYAAAISTDIRSAFYNAIWPAILSSLILAPAPGHIHRSLRSYFCDQTVTCEGQTLSLSRECPQGSDLGPTLWNITHDAAIEEISAEYPDVTRYADDFILYSFAKVNFLKFKLI